ncbi:MAG: cytidine deaminase [Pseudobdellovibrionaceae bacterium]
MAKKNLAKNNSKKLIAAALAAQKKAHAPYSGYKIGAAVLFSDGRVLTGNNIENASYGATVCAERVAIWKGISEGSAKIVEVAVTSAAENPWPPCGMCRQVIAEFAGKNVLIHSGNGKIVRTTAFKDLFPEAFEPSYLKKK